MGGPLTPSHARQRQTSVKVSVDSDIVGGADRVDDHVGQDVDVVDPATGLPLLGGSEANVAEALEVS